MTSGKQTTPGRQAAIESALRITRWKAVIQAEARAINVAPSLIAAMISRETAGLDKWCQPPNKGGKLGDDPDGDGPLLGHGHGPMQIDDRSAPYWTTQWRASKLTLADGIHMGCQMLKGKRSAIIRLIPEMPESLQLQAAVAAYNCGEGNVRKAYRAKKDLDTYTAHGNYSRDVFERAAYFASVSFDKLGE